ncbi:carbon starvation protein A [Candidatus Bathyarchaeota archaeon ex4484_135]|nr:MAG: carbon starvation protein A [Candidatus Bathyarchaeota archaeon ex4484_135]
MAEVYPLYFVLAGVIVYGAAYFLYARWYDKNVWEPDPKRATPAHMYMDGIEFFPTSKYVLFGFQFKGIAALGPILGPFIGLTFGWVPALIWLLIGNFFIGWIHDYSALFMSVRNEGRTMGPLTYELISPRARTSLLGFLLFYLILITSVFVLLCGLFFCLWPGSLIVTILTIISGLIMGLLMYRMRVPIIHATIIGIIIICIGIWAGGYTQAVAPKLMINPATGKPYLWVGMLITAIICFIGAVTPIIWWTQPVNYAAFWPCTAGVILIILAAFASPATGVAIEQPAFAGDIPGIYKIGVGPVWPILTVSIACGAISGWHSLVGTSGSARQLDVETDALPVGAGAMLMEGLLALSALSSYMVLTPSEVVKYVTKWGCFVAGACKLVAPMFGLSPDNAYLIAFFGSFLELYAITVEQMVVRFFRLALGEVTAGRPVLRAWIGNKYSAAAICLLVGGIFAYSGAWINLWLLFGGSNQLLAGLALLLTSIYLAKVRKPTAFNLGPAIFMIFTCEAALIWETFFIFLGLGYLPLPPEKQVGLIFGKPIAKGPLAELIKAGVGWAKGVAMALNIIFFLFGLILIVLGAIVAYDGFRSYFRFKRAPPEKAEE